MKFIDLFSGIGGFRLGLEKASSEYKCVWSCDNNKYANQVYTTRFGEENHFAGNIRSVDPNTTPNFNMLCAGFPCQPFSTAGKRRGFAETNGTLFYDILRVARAKKPRLLLLENVKGLLSHDQGKTFTVILNCLEELGYWIEWQVLNSKYFGVPQNRERVFIIGHSRGTDTAPVFPIAEECRDTTKGVREAQEQHTAHTVISGYGQRNMRGSYIAQPCLTPNRIKKRQHGRRFKEAEDPMFTLTAQDQHGLLLRMPDMSNTICDGWLMDTRHHSKPMNQYRIRRLTPVECERLQGFPDNWTKELSDTQRYKCLGNAVTVPVITFLGTLLLRSVSNETNGSGGSKQ